MTDIPSGSKRPYEGEHDGNPKRRREDDENRSRPRDWREVHLRTDSHRERDTARDRDRDRRGRGGYRRGDDYYRRDGRDRDRDRDRDRRLPHSRDSRPRHDDRKSSHHAHPNGTSMGRESDMEEGECVSTTRFLHSIHAVADSLSGFLLVGNIPVHLHHLIHLLRVVLNQKQSPQSHT
jgi:hypothetical protein